jgi:hypothetical protein
MEGRRGRRVVGEIVAGAIGWLLGCAWKEDSDKMAALYLGEVVVNVKNARSCGVLL